MTRKLVLTYTTILLKSWVRNRAIFCSLLQMSTTFFGFLFFGGGLTRGQGIYLGAEKAGEKQKKYTPTQQRPPAKNKRVFSYPSLCVCCYRVLFSTFSCHFRPRSESATFVARHKDTDQVDSSVDVRYLLCIYLP